MITITPPTGASASARPLRPLIVIAMTRAALRLSAAFAAILLVAIGAMLTPQPVALALQAAPSPQFAPPPPSNLAAYGEMASVLLYWDALNDPSITSYQYRQKRADQDWSVWTDVPDMRKAGESISACISGLDAAIVYQFQLRAINAVGPGPPSPTVSAMPFKRTSAPTHVTIVADDDDATIAWRNGGNGVGGVCPTLGYFVRVEDNQTGAVVAEVKIGNPGITSWYMDELLKPSTRYILRIQAYSNTQSTAWNWTPDDDGCTSSDVSEAYHFATTATAATAPPPTPSNFTAYGDNRASVSMHWDISDGPSIGKYQYRQRKGDGDWEIWTDIDGSDASTSSHTVTSLDVGIVYQFQVRAVNAFSPGASSPTVSATPIKTASMPTDVTVIPGTDDATISWSNGGNGEGGDCPTLGYEVKMFQRLSPTEWPLLDTSKIEDATTTNWYVDGLIPATLYQVHVRAYSDERFGCMKSNVWVSEFMTTGSSASTPSAPSNLRAEAGIEEARLYWDDPENQSIGKYQYRQKEYGDVWGSWIDLDNSDASTTSHKVASLDAGVRYWFQLRAENTTGPGAAALADATPADLNTLEDIIVAPGDDHATISWSVDDGGEDEDCQTLGGLARISQLATQGGWALLDLLEFQDATTSWHVDGLIPATQYHIDVGFHSHGGIDCLPPSLSTYFTTTGSSASALPAPSNLRAEAGVREATLSWDDPENQSIESYQYRQKQQQDGVWGSWINIDASDASTTSHTVGSLQPGISYLFQVRAVGASHPGAASLTDAVPTEGIVTVIPGDNHATISWSIVDNGEGGNCPIASYYVQINQLTTRDEWDLLDQSMFQDATTTSWYVNGLIPGAEYFISVQANRDPSRGCASFSLGLDFTTTGSTTSTLSAPNNLRAEAGAGEVTLYWDDPENQSIAKYQYRQKRQNGVWGSWTEIDGSNASTISHTVTPLNVGVWYWFQVRAVSAIGSGAAALTDAMPTEEIVTVVPGDDHVTISWRAAGGEDEDCPTRSYRVRIYQLTTQAEWALLDLSEIQDATATSVYVDGLLPATRYSTFVKAYSDPGRGCETRRLSTHFTTTGSTTSTPSAPSNLRAEAGIEEATLSWDDPENQSIESYQYRQKGPDDVWGSWIDIDNSDASTMSHKVASLDAGVRYWFQLRAENAAGPGAASLTEAVPTAGIVVVPGDDHATISWSADDSGEGGNCPTIGYHASIGAIPPLDTSTIEDAATTSWYVDGLIPATEYYVSVTTYSNAGYDCPTRLAEITFTTTGSAASTPPPPTNLRAESNMSEMILYWDSPDDHAIEGYQYRQKRRYGTWEPWTDIANSGASTTSHTVTSLNPGIPYRFQVRAVSAVGPGAVSFLQVMPPGDDNSMKPGVPAGRIVARRLSDGRTELGYRPEGQDRILPAQRFFPANAPLARWLHSSDVLLPGVSVYGDPITEAIGRISARLLADGRIELAFTDLFGRRMRPAQRYVPASNDGKWLRSAPFGN